MKKSFKDHAQAFTNMVIEHLEKGDLTPFRIPWVGGQPHQSLATLKPYSGINTLILAFSAYENKFSSPYWMTYKQAQAKGWHVKKGSKGTAITFFKELEFDEIDEKTGEKKKGYCRQFYTVFNIDQIEGAEAPEVAEVFAERDLDEKAAAMVEHIERYGNAAGVRHSIGDAAYYTPSTDTVTMPENFVCADAYAAVLAHEYIHSTGHKKRLNRFKGNEVAFKTHREEYAFEEIITELAAGILCAQFGIESRHDQHVSYIGGWLEALRSDKDFIFKAASQSQKALNLIEELAAPQALKAA